jgi:uncharacterized membrane protein YkoI
MKSKWILLGLLALLPALGQAHDEGKEHSWKGSIAVKGKVAETELPGLAKISLEAAMATALQASPGSVTKAEMEIEHGSLIYSFDIVSKDKKLMEVNVDAGNGKVLMVGEEKDEGDEKDGDKRDGGDGDDD